MSVKVRLFNIESPNDFIISIKAGNSPYPLDSGYYQYGGVYQGTITSEVIIDNFSFNYNRQYWIKLTDQKTNRHIIENIYIHDFIAYFDCVMGGTPTPTITPTPTQSPQVQLLTQYCYIGTYVQGDLAHPNGGTITYWDEWGVMQTLNNIYSTTQVQIYSSAQPLVDGAVVINCNLTVTPTPTPTQTMCSDYLISDTTPLHLSGFAEYEYNDCDGNRQTFFIYPHYNSITICAQDGSLNLIDGDDTYIIISQQSSCSSITPTINTLFVYIPNL